MNIIPQLSEKCNSFFTFRTDVRNFIKKFVRFYYLQERLFRDIILLKEHLLHRKMGKIIAE